MQKYYTSLEKNNIQSRFKKYISLFKKQFSTMTIFLRPGKVLVFYKLLLTSRVIEYQKMIELTVFEYNVFD